MTKDDILRMGREAGLFTHKEVQPEIERFANSVYALAAEREREACAKVCEASINDYQYPTMTVLAAAIRARKTHD